MSVYNIDGNIVSTNYFVSVKDFDAKGNGTTDDATAIQSAIDSIKTTGGIIYFPSGTYLITEALIFYSKQTLWFENGAKILQGASINNLLRSYCESTWGGYDGTHDCLIYGATFDGGAYTEQNTLVGIAHAKNIVFENCAFKNAYGGWHNLEINSSYNVKIVNCDFEGSRKTHSYGELIQIDSASNSVVYPWDGTKYDGTVCKYIDIIGCIFHNDTVSPAVGTHTNASHSFVKIHDCIFDGLTSSRGAIDFAANMTNLDVYGNTFNGCTTGVGSSGSTYYIHDNRFVDVTTAINGSTSVAHNNMVNGTFVS